MPGGHDESGSTRPTTRPGETPDLSTRAESARQGERPGSAAPGAAPGAAAGERNHKPADRALTRRVLIVAPDMARAESLALPLSGDGWSCERRRRVPPRAMSRAGADRYDLAVLAGAPLDPVLGESARRLASAGVPVLFVSASPSLADAVGAMRAGADDLLTWPIQPEALIARARELWSHGLARREQQRRIDRLEQRCRRLRRDKRAAVQQVDRLCTDLAEAYDELGLRMNQVTLASEFSDLIRRHLDIESLLRTTLEFVLARTGPTNAAVFLPATSGDYSLGAYVNFDCPKDTVEILLDHLANVIAPRLARENDMIACESPDALHGLVGDDAEWLGDSSVLGLPCRHDDETLAVLLLFRDLRTGYAPALSGQLKTIGELFASQLARVIQIHHRHLPREKWGAPGDPDDEGEDGGLAM